MALRVAVQYRLWAVEALPPLKHTGLVTQTVLCCLLLSATDVFPLSFLLFLI